MNNIRQLGDILDSISITHKFNKDELIFLNTSDVLEGKILIDNYVKVDTLKGQAKKTIKNGDILFSEIRPKNKRYAYVNVPNPEDYVVSTKLMVLRNKSTDVLTDYIYYFLTYEGTLDYLQMRAENRIGSFPQITFDHIKILELQIPDLPTQQKIAAVLSALDAKIELNNRINAELGAMAKTLYDYWFVQFDFPDESGRPYKTSGGKMVWNEELKREIPEGWECYELSKIISRISTGLNPRENFSLGKGLNYYVTIKNIDNWKIHRDDKCDKIDDDALSKINKRSDLRVGDILFTSIEPVGITYLIQEEPKNWNINESVFTLRPNYNWVTAEYALLLLSGKEIKAFTKNVSAGSIHKGVRIGVLNTFKVPYGKKIIIEKFSKITQPILTKIHLLDKENQQLSELRDWLLPMLMNGQVRVG